MIYCQNCGYESHCGTNYTKVEINEAGEETRLKVCTNCRCDNCVNADFSCEGC